VLKCKKASSGFRMGKADGSLYGCALKSENHNGTYSILAVLFRMFNLLRTCLYLTSNRYRYRMAAKKSGFLCQDQDPFAYVMEFPQTCVNYA